MDDDLVHKLRGASQVAYSSDIELYLKQEDCREAADEIERLRAALKPFADYAHGMEPGLVSFYPDPCPIRATPANGRESGMSPTVGDCRVALRLIEQSGRDER